MSFMNLQTMADSYFPHGRRYYTKSGYFTYLDDDSIDRLVEAVATIPSSETQIELAYLGWRGGADRRERDCIRRSQRSVHPEFAGKLVGAIR